MDISVNTEIFCWNVRGFNKQEHQAGFKKWFRNRRPVLGSLIETHVKQAQSSPILKSTLSGWNFAANYEHSDLGKICVVWDSKIIITVISKLLQMITCLVKLPNQPHFVISFVYASTNKDERAELWREFLSISQSPYSGYPWTLLGDLNQVLNPDEDSISDGYRVTSGMRALRSCLLSSGLSDLSHRGSQFTWWNNRVSAPIAKKLDKILINDEWLTHFTLSIGFFGEPDFSDHSS